VKYAWIENHRDQYPVRRLCQVLGVSHSGYYHWRRRRPSRQAQQREQIRQAAREAHHASHGIYGYRKVHEDLQEQNILCCLESVRRAMREQGLFSRVKRKFVVTTDSQHHFPPAENLLARDFTATGPNQKWSTDITYIRTREGWLYLAVVMDLFSRRIVGWATSASLETSLVLEALRKAVAERNPPPGLLHHSDRGSQYASDTYGDLLATRLFLRSMSRKGNCWDNAPVESFFGKLKTEWMTRDDYETREQATLELFKYIDLFYNRQRRHAAINYQSPAAFEQQHQARTAKLAG
jgi:putative transposase